MKIENLDRLKRKLAHLAVSKLESPNSIKGESVVVGYTAGYALYVHENEEIWPPGMRLKGLPRPKGKGKYWDPQNKAQPKFLEHPARELNNSGELSRIVVEAMRRGVKLQQALSLAALRIQRESQKLVPVDTGNLKASAFTQKE